MDIYAYLKKDHRKVISLFEKIIHSPLADSNLEVFDELTNELLIHSDAEKNTFYKALKKDVLGCAEAIFGAKEHADIKHIIRAINKLSVNTSQWLIEIGELKSTVLHHIKHEETEIFKVAKKILSKKEAMNLVLEMNAAKDKLFENAYE